MALLTQCQRSVVQQARSVVLLAARQSAPDGHLAESLAKVPLQLGLQTGSCLRKTDSQSFWRSTEEKQKGNARDCPDGKWLSRTYILPESFSLSVFCLSLSLLPFDTHAHTHICKFVDNLLKHTHLRFLSSIKGALVQMWARTRARRSLASDWFCGRIVDICEQRHRLLEWYQLWEPERSLYTGNRRPSSWGRCQNAFLHCAKWLIS